MGHTLSNTVWDNAPNCNSTAMVIAFANKAWSEMKSNNVSALQDSIWTIYNALSAASYAQSVRAAQPVALHWTFLRFL